MRWTSPEKLFCAVWPHLHCLLYVLCNPSLKLSQISWWNIPIHFEKRHLQFYHHLSSFFFASTLTPVCNITTGKVSFLLVIRMHSSEGMITCLSHHNHSVMSELFFSMGNNIFTKIVLDVFSVDLIIRKTVSYYLKSCKVAFSHSQKDMVQQLYW